jgi:hypothetical protein
MAGIAAAAYRLRLQPQPPNPMRALSIVSLLAFAAAAVAQTPLPSIPAKPAAAAPAAQDPKAAPKKLDETKFDHFGAGIVEGAATPIADVMKAPEQFTGKTVRVEAPITGVCQTKGCWMQLGSQQPTVFVKFKDYAFFVPKDASGRTAIVEGTMTMKQETVEQTKHYLEDAGKHDEAAKVTEGRKLYHFMATGVAIAKPQPKKLDESKFDHFGAGIVEGAATPIADVMKAPEQFTGKTVRVEAPITGVCQTKGCWMQLGSQQPTVFVKFKDYAFFVPKDASGRTAIVEGVMTMKQETVEQTKHYLEDAGKHEEAAKVTEGRKLYHFMATGVAIAKPGK